MRLWRDEQGQSLVEFTLVLPALLLLVLGIVEFGWLFNGQITITSAAREGARAAAVGEDPQAAVERHVQGTSLTVTGVVVTPGGEAAERWNEVQVEGRIEPLVGFFVRDAVNLSAGATMRVE